VSAKGEEDIRARVAGKFDPAAWWKAVSGGPYAVPLDEALADADLVIVALSAPYMQMVAPALALAGCVATRLRIVGINKDAVRGLRAAHMPYEKSSLDKLMPGTGFDFSARALKHFVTVVWPRHPHCGSEAELAEHQRLVRDA